MSQGQVTVLWGSLNELLGKLFSPPLDAVFLNLAVYLASLRELGTLMHGFDPF